MVLDVEEPILLPNIACERIPHAQLALVTAQTRFPAVTRLDERVQDLREALRREYPVFADEKALNIVIRDGRAGTEEGGRVLRFSSIDMHWSVVVSEDYVALETRTYDGISAFAARADEVWRVVDRILNPQYQTRFGFRFVNEFRHPEGDEYATWRRLLNPELLGFDAKSTLGGSVRQTISEVVLDRNDGQLVMRRGFLRGTTVTPLPGATTPNTGFFLLDLDYSDSTPGSFDPVPSTRLRAYNTFMYRIFRWAVGEGEYLGFLKGQRK